MARFVSLKARVSLFLIISAVVLMGSLLSFLYISGRKSVVTAARREIRTDARLFTENARSELSNNFLELTSLRYQMERLPIHEGKEVGQEELWGRFIAQFLTGYAQKYRFLLFKKPEWSQFLSARPVKIFGGETRIRFDWVKRPAVPERLLTTPRDSLSWRFFPGKVSSENQLLYLRLFSRKEKSLFLLAARSSDTFPEEILRNLNLSRWVSARVTEQNGLILFSPRKSEINRFLPQAVPELQSLWQRNGFRRNGSRLFYAERVGVPPFRVIFKKELSPEFHKLNATLLRMILFATGIFMVVLAVVWLMAKRMTDTLGEISAVAERVAEGDFSRKIALHRQDELGRLIDTFNAMIDHTRASYHSMQNLNLELSEKVAELTRTRAELSRKQRLAIIGETVSKISHEIQNKIGGVSIWLQNLEMELKSNSAAAMYIHEMKTALRSFLDMLTHFKRFYREPQLQKEPVEIHSVTDAVIKQFLDEIRAKGLKIVRTEPSVLRPILADPQQVEEAFLNILINAIYYSPPGGTITIDVQADLEWMVISFSDEGPGVPEEHARNLFQPFFTTKSSGSGLGLAIADSIVRAHGGKISFKNLPEGGTRFTIRLPFENKITTNSGIKST